MAYFKIFPIGANPWYIKDTTGVGSYLFEGGEKALLLDTCNGFRDIRKTVGKLTDKPLTVVNSHGHSDHAGGNNQFQEVYIHPADLFMTEASWQKNQRDTMYGYVKKRLPLLSPFLNRMERNRPCIYDAKHIAIEGGAAFDLGGRTLPVTHCPGHSPGSIILADEQTKTLYVGDAINSGMFLFFEGSPKLAEYAVRLREIAKLDGFDEIRGSHSEDPLPFSFIGYYADFLDRVTMEKSKATGFPNEGNVVYGYKEDGRSIGIKSVAVYFTKDQV
jgi:glyoxylase-like metal-dependent hydrolase (beta-lactamase superfamily II)